MLSESASESRLVVSDSLRPQGLYSPWNPPGQDTGVGSLSLLQEIFPTQGSNPGLPHCKWIIYQLGHKGSPRILEWVTCPFSRGSSRPRDRTRVSCIAGGFWRRTLFSLGAKERPPTWTQRCYSRLRNSSWEGPETEAILDFLGNWKASQCAQS